MGGTQNLWQCLKSIKEGNGEYIINYLTNSKARRQLVAQGQVQVALAHSTPRQP